MQMMKLSWLIRQLLCCALLLAGILGVSTAEGATGWDRLTAESAVIVRGSVVSVTTGAPENPYANHRATVKVQRVLKGPSEQQITVVYPGPAPDLPARASAQADGVPVYQLKAGDERIFLLSGHHPYRLSSLQEGIQPVEAEAQVQAAMTSLPVELSVTPATSTVRAGAILTLNITLKARGDAVSAGLPADMRDGCRVWSWYTTGESFDGPFSLRYPFEAPSAYEPFILDAQRGISCTIKIRAPRIPNDRLPQQAMVCAAVCVQMNGEAMPFCFTSAPIAITITK